MPKWEYAVMWLQTDPGSADRRSHGWLRLPGAEQFADLGAFNGWDFLDQLGLDGWELVGPPTSQKAVFTYLAKNDTWHDRSYAVETTYIFKRAAKT